jgi:hypothetical protein
VYSSTTQYPPQRFLNYVSGVFWQFDFSALVQVLDPGTAGQTLSYSLENDHALGLLNSVTFMSIDASNGTISFASSSDSSNFTHFVTAKAGLGTDCIVVQ